MDSSFNSLSVDEVHQGRMDTTGAQGGGDGPYPPLTRVRTLWRSQGRVDANLRHGPSGDGMAAKLRVEIEHVTNDALLDFHASNWGGCWMARIPIRLLVTPRNRPSSPLGIQGCASEPKRQGRTRT